MAENQVNTVELRLMLRDLVSAEAAKVAASLKAVNAQAVAINQTSNRSRFGVGGLLGLFGGVGVVESIRKALDLAKQSEEAQARLSIAVGGSISQYKALQSVIESISKTSVYSQADLTSTAEELLNRGVGADKIPQALQTVVNTASALRQPLDEVAKQVAITFGGTVPRELGRAVPALKNLSEEALRSGAALDTLSKAFDGRAALFAATDPGKEQAELRDIAQGWTDIGKAMLPIERTLLPGLASGFKVLSELAQNHQEQGSFAQAVNDVLRQKTGGMIGLGDAILPAGSTDASVQRDVTAQLAKEQRDALAAEAKDSLSRQGPIENELQSAQLNGLEDTNKKHEAEVARSTEEEFKQRVVSLHKYLDELDKSSEAERSRLASLAATTRDQLGSVTADLKANRDRLNGLQNTGDPAKDSLIQEAREKLELKIVDDLQKQLDLTKALTEATQNIRDADQQRVDAQAKAVEDAIKNLPETATRGVKSVQDGNETWQQLRSQITDQFNQINAALPATFSLADKILNPDDAAALKQRITTALADAQTQAHKAADSVTPLISDLNAIGDQAQKSLTGDLANSLTEIETKAKSVHEALTDMLQSLVKQVLEIINQRLSEQLVNSLFGAPGDGKGGARANGGLLGGALGLGESLLGSLFGGNLKSGAPTSGNGPTGTVPGKEGGNGDSSWASLIDEILGAVGISGNTFTKATQNTNVGGTDDPWSQGDVLNVDPSVSGDGAAGGGAGAEGSDEVDTSGYSAPDTGSDTPDMGGDDDDDAIEIGFARGGYTGDGPANRVAGVVHAGEYVMPADRVRQIGVNSLRSISASMFRDRSGRVSIHSGGSMTGSNRELISAVNRLADIHSRPISVAVPVNEDTVRQIVNHPSNIRLQADMMQRNPGVYGPAVRKLNRGG